MGRRKRFLLRYTIIVSLIYWKSLFQNEGGFKMKENKLIKRFISRIKERYPHLIIDYDHYPESDEYDIWHVDYKLQFEDIEFLKYVGELMKEILFDNEVFNYSFGYDYLKAKALFNDNSYANNVDVFTSFISNSNERINFYYSNIEPIKLEGIKTSLIFSGENRANNFNVSNGRDNYVLSLINKSKTEKQS